MQADKNLFQIINFDNLMKNLPKSKNIKTEISENELLLNQFKEIVENDRIQSVRPQSASKAKPPTKKANKQPAGKNKNQELPDLLIESNIEVELPKNIPSKIYLISCPSNKELYDLLFPNVINFVYVVKIENIECEIVQDSIDDKLYQEKKNNDNIDPWANIIIDQITLNHPLEETFTEFIRDFYSKKLSNISDYLEYKKWLSTIPIIEEKEEPEHEALSEKKSIFFDKNKQDSVSCAEILQMVMSSVGINYELDEIVFNVTITRF